jgi:phosphonate transport system substrate-binding protein
MEMGKILVVVSISACVIAVAVACMAGIFGTENPEEQTLRIGLIPTEDQLEMLRKFEPAKAYLERELDMPVETFTATDYTAVIEAMRAKKIDVAYLGPFSYVLATERANAEAIVTGGTDTGDVATYHSCIITHKDSGLKNIDNLKENANEVTFAFVDPASTSGNLIPRGYLLSIGIDPDTDLKECMFAGGHDAVGLSVKSEKVDAGAMYDIGYRRKIRKR